MTGFVLCSTYHDSDFRLKELIALALPKIKNLFVESIVCLTPFTSQEVIDFLSNHDVIAILEPSVRHIDTYRTALKTSLEHINDSKTQKVFFIDFDRLIHWVNNYPEELTNILKNHLDVEYLHIGRTSRAFNTHPTTQKKTEIIVNERGSKILGFNDTKDLISVCYIFSKELGQRLLEVNHSTASGFYSTWPIYLWSYAPSKRYVEVEGHEWETPDRFKDEIDEIGIEKWMMQFQSAEEWNKRVKILHNCLLELFDCVKLDFLE